MQNKITWQQIPLIRLSCPILVGATLYLYFPVHLPVYYMIGLAGILFISLFTVSRKYWFIPFFIFCLLFGYFHFQSRDHVYGDIPDLPQDTLTSRILVAKNIQWDASNNRWKGTFLQSSGLCLESIKVYAWIEKPEQVQSLKRNDTLWVRSSLQSPTPPDIPGSFDFRQFLQRKNIPFITYVNAGHILKYQSNDGNDILKILKEWRARAKDRISKSLSPLTASILQAILFGDSGNLSDETRATFSKAGIAHILAVSGMHVGILIMIIIWVVQQLNFPPDRKQWIQFFVIIAGVWLYVAICDFAASASRAALMASLYYLGKAMKIRASAFNALGCSALVLFLIDPFYLLDLGTQLSFAAMAGILLSFPALENLLVSNVGLPNKISSLFAISFAAQAGVAPLILYYFGSFPLLFWLFSIPAAYFAVFLFVGGWVWVFCPAWAASVKGLISMLLNKVTQFFVGSLSDDIWGNLPTWEIPYFPLLYLVFSYLLILRLIMILLQSSTIKMRSALIQILVIVSLWQFHLNHHQQILHVEEINLKDQRSWLLVHNRQAYVLSSQKVPRMEDIRKNLQHAYPIDSIQFGRINSHSEEILTAFLKSIEK